MPNVLTPAQAKDSLNRQGKTVAQFAREIGVNQFIVYRLLDGRLKGRSGQAHRAAVALGMKCGEVPFLQGSKS